MQCFQMNWLIDTVVSMWFEGILLLQSGTASRHWPRCSAVVNPSHMRSVDGFLHWSVASGTALHHPLFKFSWGRLVAAQRNVVFLRRKELPSFTYYQLKPKVWNLVTFNCCRLSIPEGRGSNHCAHSWIFSSRISFRCVGNPSCQFQLADPVLVNKKFNCYIEWA